MNDLLLFWGGKIILRKLSHSLIRGSLWDKYHLCVLVFCVSPLHNELKHNARLLILMAFNLNLTLVPCCVADNNRWNTTAVEIHAVIFFFRVIGALYLKPDWGDAGLNCRFHFAGHLTSAEEPDWNSSVKLLTSYVKRCKSTIYILNSCP